MENRITYNICSNIQLFCMESLFCVPIKIIITYSLHFPGQFATVSKRQHINGNRTTARHNSSNYHGRYTLHACKSSRNVRETKHSCGK